MRPMTLSELAAPLQATLTGADAVFQNVCTDSRSLQRGDLFVALCGEHFDGHDYVAQAVAGGAAAALVSRPLELPVPQLRVADTRAALTRAGVLTEDVS